METPTIYIVTSGDYSDYSIKAVFTDEAAADAYEKEICGGFGNVEAWGANEQSGWVMRNHYCSRIRLDNGDIIASFNHPEAADPNARVPAESLSDDLDGTMCGHSYVSQEHATKLAVEARQSYLRNRSLSREMP